MLKCEESTSPFKPIARAIVYRQLDGMDGMDNMKQPPQTQTRETAANFPMKTVLFIHGLESGPQGNKPRALAEAGYNVVSEQMPCGRRHLFRDPWVVGASLAAATTVSVIAFSRGIRSAIKASALLATSTPWAYRAIVRRAFRRSVAVQKNCLQQHKIDVVVGSSFGGAVALELLHSGLWSGPTVLLCPAHQLVANRAHEPIPKGLAALANSSNILVIHGQNDEIVPIDHSRALVERSNAKLIEVQDDHRLSANATAANLAQWVEQAFIGHTSVSY